jgi:hypothetical protein
MAGPTITQRIALDGADQIKQALSQIGKAGQEAFQQIRDAGEGVKLSAIEAAATGAAKEAAAAQSSAAEASAGGFARGGPIFGPGTSTSDSVPIWASVGEFMVRAAAVRKYGANLFHALNSMRLPPDLFRGFSQGGLVDRLQVLMPPLPPLRFADGGLVPAPAGGSNLRPINLQIGSEMFAGMLAPEDVAQKLLRVAVTRQIRSAGRKPSYYGKGR